MDGGINTTAQNIEIETSSPQKRPREESTTGQSPPAKKAKLDHTENNITNTSVINPVMQDIPQTDNMVTDIGINNETSSDMNIDQVESTNNSNIPKIPAEATIKEPLKPDNIASLQTKPTTSEIQKEINNTKPTNEPTNVSTNEPTNESTNVSTNVPTNGHTNASTNVSTSPVSVPEIISQNENTASPVVETPQNENKVTETQSNNSSELSSDQTEETIKALSERKRELEEKLREVNENLEKITKTLESQSNLLPKTKSKAKSKAKPRKTTTKKTNTTPKSKTKTKSSPTSGINGSQDGDRPKRQRKKSNVLKEAEANTTNTTTKVDLSPSLASCKSVLNAIYRHKFGFPFLTPVDPVALNIPDYFKIITNPMDFGTIKEKLYSGKYNDLSEFIHDADLVFTNACTYNHPTSDVYVMAETLQKFFKKKIKPIEDRARRSRIKSASGQGESKKSKQDSKSKYATDTKKVSPVKKRAPAKPKTPKTPKPLPPSEVPMSKAEMRQLSATINSLSYKHLNTIIVIIQQSMPNLASEGEIEIDLHSLDTTTLRKLEAFVSTVKKSKSKSKSKNKSSQIKESSEIAPSLSSTPGGGSTEETVRVEDSSSDDSESSSSDSSSGSSSDSESESDTESDPEDNVLV